MENPVLQEILAFFGNVFEVRGESYKYADYKSAWLDEIGLSKKNYAEEASSARTTARLQEHLRKKFGDRVKVEAPVGEGMHLRFDSLDSLEQESKFDLDTSKLQAFDVLDVETGTAFEISLSDAFAEVFKDLLKGLLDSRVKDLYICMRNHSYRGSKKSGYPKVRDSKMIQQYIMLARLYKLHVHLVDLYPECNSECEATPRQRNKKHHK